MIDATGIKTLLRMPEVNHIDFKGAQYDLSSARSQKGKGYLDLIKDILCMANTPRDTSAFILTGVVNKPGKLNRVIGITQNVDDNKVQQLIQNFFKPIPHIVYYEVNYQAKVIGVFEVSNSRLDGPYYIRKDLSPRRKQEIDDNRDFLSQDQLYFRRGSTNAIATQQDAEYIRKWFAYTQGETWQDWSNLKQDCNYFSHDQKYILVTDSLRYIDSDRLVSLSHIDWSVIIDFDHTSGHGGGLLNILESKTLRRNILRVVKKQRQEVAFNPDRNLYWYFARGLVDLEASLALGKWPQWRNQYGSEIDQQFKELARVLLPNEVIFIILWNEQSLLRHLKTTIESTTIFETARYIFISSLEKQLEREFQDFFDSKFYSLPMDQFLSGLAVELSDSTYSDTEAYTFPSSSGAPAEIPIKRLSWLEAGLDLVHLGVGISESNDDPLEFLRGATITWHELSIGRDAERNITRKIKRRINQDLLRRRTTIVNLYHTAGAGGTTVGRRLLWDIHTEYPCVIINDPTKTDIADRIALIVSITNQPVLAMLDSQIIDDKFVKALADSLDSNSTACVLLVVSRRQYRPSDGFYLALVLDTGEIPRFREKYISEVPTRRNLLNEISDRSPVHDKTAFNFGLITYDENYLGIPSFVASRIKNLTEPQLQILLFLSLAYKYGQQGMNSNYFREVIGVIDKVSLGRVFESNPIATDLVIVLDGNDWRPIHNLIAQEIIQQVLVPDPNTDKQVWRQQLSEVSKKFIEFCEGNRTTVTDNIIKLLRRMFIFRDNVGFMTVDQDEFYPNQNSSILSKFSQLLQDIPSSEGRVEVLKHLVTYFPYEAHFWAHLGRYQAKVMRNFKDAIKSCEHAVNLQPDDHVLWNMQGVSYREYVRELISQDEELQTVVNVAELATECFEESRSINPDDEPSYIAEIQLITDVLDYAGKRHNGNIFDYLKTYNVPPYVRDALEKAESLLAIVRSNREGKGRSTYERQCRASISQIYGDYHQALQIWENLLSRENERRPSLRRQIVYVYIDRDQGWSAMNHDTLYRSIQLLNDNLDENPSNTEDLRLWLQANRFASSPPSIDSVIEKVSYWKANTGSLESAYYLYVLHSLRAMDGLSVSRDAAERFLEESRRLSSNRSNRLKSFEWLGDGKGIQKLVHQSELGDWNKSENFWSNERILTKVEGIVTNIKGPEAGTVDINGLTAFFVPAANKTQPITLDSINRRVNFYLGFSYSGLRAWSVNLI